MLLILPFANRKLSMRHLRKAVNHDNQLLKKLMRPIVPGLSVLIILIISCTSQRENVMPFKNFDESGIRPFPVATNASQFTFRASVNLSTSIDRILSISTDSILGDQGRIVEIWQLGRSKKGQVKVRYVERPIIPRSGFQRFKQKVDSLNIISITSQDAFDLPFDRPFSLYAIEVKQNEKYNQFNFNSHFPDTTNKVERQYEQIQELILQEFDFPLYLK